MSKVSVTRTFKGEPPSDPNQIPEFVFEISKLEYTGNIVPHSWYSHITYKGRYRDKPYYLAILILADIVYWSRLTEVKDDQGAIIGHKKKFKYDLIQRTCQQYSDMFGESDHDVREAIAYLVDNEYIQRELWNYKTKTDIMLVNVPFVAPNAKKIAEINIPKKLEQEDSVCSENGGLNTNRYPHQSPIGIDGIPQEAVTNTEITTKTTSENTELIQDHQNSEDHPKENSAHCAKRRAEIPYGDSLSEYQLRSAQLCIKSNTGEKEKTKISAIMSQPDFDLQSPDEVTWDKSWLLKNRDHRLMNDSEYTTKKPSLAEFVTEAELMEIPKTFAVSTYNSWSKRDWKFEGSKDPIKIWTKLLALCFEKRESEIANSRSSRRVCSCGKKYQAVVIDSDEDPSEFICPKCGKQLDCVLDD